MAQLHRPALQRRAVTELGFKATFMRPNPINGRHWHDPYYDPLWAELQRLDVPVGFHEGGLKLPLPRETARKILWDNWARLYRV